MHGGHPPIRMIEPSTTHQTVVPIEEESRACLRRDGGERRWVPRIDSVLAEQRRGKRVKVFSRRGLNGWTPKSLRGRFYETN